MLACLPTKVCPPTALASNLVWLTVRLASPAPKISGVMLAIFSTKARPPKALLKLLGHQANEESPLLLTVHGQ